MTSQKIVSHRPNSDELKAFTKAWRSTIDLSLIVTSEKLSFASRRLQVQANHPSALARCQTMLVTLQKQTTFAQAAISDYIAEANNIMKGVRSALVPGSVR